MAMERETVPIFTLYSEEEGESAKVQKRFDFKF